MNIFGMGPMELLLIVVLALIVFGPARLPEIMGQVGKAINDFRRATSELSDEFNKTIQAELQETKAVVDETKSAFTEVRSTVADAHSSVTSAVSGIPAPTRTAVPAPTDALPAPNGTGLDDHAETGANGTSSATVPPMADTAQWSWETSAPAPPKTPSEETASPSEKPTVESPSANEKPTVESPSASDKPTAESPPVPSTPTSDSAELASPAPPTLPATKERAARDELSPPY
jgi:sec-independent protein translocase protein TatB